MKDKFIIALIVIGVAVAGWTGWKLVFKNQVDVLPTPTPVSVATGASTTEMMQTLQLTVDDAGASDLQQLEQEVNQL